ncbi:hypothetical protein MKZ38_001562 [Zalerion maritima]|uniref:Uncharacterized protein n=1 Tax=Zalerion maritima TaxID=339359 RepID=A0AAD5RQ44_9PEZI|nr:hypothetical protein MKZ38_001562 [Zalerion maritima]
MKFSTAILAGLAAVATAVPTSAEFQKMWSLAKRQNEAAAAMGLTDVDILQFALTLEWLETEFYRQGFATFPASDFQALGVNAAQINDLTNIGVTEAAHVGTLQSAIAQAGVQPVQPCQYNFGFTTAQAMVGVAAVLEQVGVSAYLGAAPLVADPGILSTAGSILTVEARHQSLIRLVSGIAAAPGAFDTALGPKAVFSLAAPFITSCPDGSNLILTAFPPLTLAQPADVAAVAVDSNISFSEPVAGATHCAFTNGGAPGGSIFTTFTEAEGCVVPQTLSGITYVSLASQGPLTGVLTDDITLAGPLVLTIS